MANTIKVIRAILCLSPEHILLKGFVKQQRSEDNVIMKYLTTDDLHGVLLVLLHGVGWDGQGN
jgi:hypothetical protein